MNKKLAYVLLALMMTTILGMTVNGIKLAFNSSPEERVVDPRPLPATYRNITAALKDSNDGDIIWVRNGTYNDHVLVNKSVTIKWDYITPGQGYPNRATVDGSGTGVIFNVTATNVQIFNITIRNAKTGIFLYRTAVNATIRGNLVSSNEDGVRVNSANNTIMSNTMVNNHDLGMYVSSTGNLLRNNNMTANKYNFGGSLANDIDSSNIVNKTKRIYIWTGVSYSQIPSDAGYVAVMNSAHITVKNLILTNNDCGVHFINVSYSNITNVETFNNYYVNVDLEHSENNKIEGAIVSGGPPYSLGILLQYSNSNRIIGNVIANCDVGVRLDDSRDNVIVGNTIKNNYDSGIYDYNGVNRFYHNNVKDNPNQVKLSYSTDDWDNYNSEGNYWSDYSGVDADGNGIGDSEYPINDNNRDDKPLIKPWKSVRVFNVAKPSDPKYWNWTMGFKGYNITVQSDHVVASLSITKTGGAVYPSVVSFNITTNGAAFCNITIPRAWLDGPFTIEGVAPSFYQLTQNSTHSSLYFTYSYAGTSRIRIVAVKSGTVPGDVNGDGKIELKDVYYIAKMYGWTLAQSIPPEDVTEYDP